MKREVIIDQWRFPIAIEERVSLHLTPKSIFGWYVKGWRSTCCVEPRIHILSLLHLMVANSCIEYRLRSRSRVASLFIMPRM
jgi:hypothetical protein